MKMLRLNLLICVGLLSVSAAHQAVAYYNPTAGRWLSRDPIEEHGNKNLNAFVANDAVNGIDPLGLQQLEVLFGAFIPSRLGRSASYYWGNSYSGVTGTWFDEPGSPPNFVADYRLTATDNRGFGGGTFRVKTKGSVDSKDIGKMKGRDESNFKTSSDISTSIRRAFRGGGVVVTTGTEHPTSMVTIEDVSRCCSKVKVRASGQYPISWASWTGIPPNIDYEITFTFKNTGGGSDGKKGTMDVEGWHDPFPNYESRLGAIWAYRFPTTFPGPSFSSLNGSPVNFKGDVTVSFDP